MAQPIPNKVCLREIRGETAVRNAENVNPN